MLRKISAPIRWYVRALDATDEWLRRFDYQGQHWAPGVQWT